MNKLKAYIWDYLLCDRVGRMNRRLITNKIERKALKNNNFTILSQNCIGAVMYNDLGKKFLSPTINLKFDPNDFVIFLENLEYYLSSNIKFIGEEGVYPIGIIGDEPYKKIKLHFVHYLSCEEALEKWNDRKKRIQWGNIFVVCQDENMEYQYIKRFDGLDRYKNKVLFTAKEYNEFNSTVYLRMYKKKGKVDNCLNFGNMLGKRKYQYGFDYIKWLNKL